MRRGVRLAMLAGALGVSVGCGATRSSADADGGVDAAVEDAGEGGDAAAADLVAWAHEQAVAECTRLVRCNVYESAGACVEGSDNRAAYDRFFGGADYVADQAATYRLADVSVRKACLDAIAASGCDDAPPTACNVVLIPLSPVAEGASCVPSNPFLDQRPCEDGFDCRTTSQSGCPVCTRVSAAGAGAPCDYDDDCQPELYCAASGGSATCQPRSSKPGLGDLCPGFQCRSGAVCQPNDAGGSFCARPGAAGDACGLQQAPCLSDLYCQSDPAKGTDICQPVSLAGAPCERSLTPAIPACAGWCVFPSPDATTGVCGTPETEGPTPCALYAVDPEVFCPEGTYQDTHGEQPPPTALPAYCMCLPKLPLGAPCSMAPDAGNGGLLDRGQCGVHAHCAGPDAANEHCIANLPAGAPCTEDTECGGYGCDPVAKRCGPICGDGGV